MLRHLLSKPLRSTFYISGAFVIYLKAGKGQRAPSEHGELRVFPKNKDILLHTHRTMIEIRK